MKLRLDKSLSHSESPRAETEKPTPDHAQNSQGPMVKDEVVAAQLEALLTPAITAQEKDYRFPGVERADTQSTSDDGGNVDSTVAGCGIRQGANRHPGERRFFVVYSPQVSPQAMSQRFLTFLAELFVLGVPGIAPQLKQATVAASPSS